LFLQAKPYCYDKLDNSDVKYGKNMELLALPHSESNNGTHNHNDEVKPVIPDEVIGFFN
jgi:hypothetical protein